jgi:hypothetical protein
MMSVESKIGHFNQYGFDIKSGVFFLDVSCLKIKWDASFITVVRCIFGDILTAGLSESYF